MYFRTFEEYYDTLRGNTKVEKPKEVVRKVKKIDYDALTVDELRQKAKKAGLTGYSKMKKTDLIKTLKEVK